MKRIFLLLFSTIVFFSCNSAVPSEGVDIAKNQELIIQERIDGPANVRDEPNGEILLELFDNAMVDVAELDNDWFKMVIYAELSHNEYVDNGREEVLIKAGRSVIQNGNVIGKFKKDIKVRTSLSNGGRIVITEIIGFTYKNNIKQNTIIERAFESNLVDHGRSLTVWKPFINKFDLDDRDDLKKEYIITFSNVDGVASMGPSPGPRMILLFDEELLVGVFHSRRINIKNTNTTKLVRYGSISFFDDYSAEKRKEIIDYMNYWVNSFN